MRSPGKNLNRLRRIYNTIQSEMPKVRRLVEIATLAAAAPDAPAMSIRVCGSYRMAYGILLAMATVLNHTLQIWDEDASLIEEMCDYIDQSIALAQQCESARPYGAIFIPDFLTMVWAAATDEYRNDELTETLLDYENDSVGADYLGHAMSIRKRLFDMEARETKEQTELAMSTKIGSVVQEQPLYRGQYQAVSECVIL
ncbi:hypothetical protein FHETE_7691 [Fusarium heterosporum]|uniref:Uncharacterized protein n=1 Tax=Fusarium heterosporum TaxID=42747 RepID=A0A8H5T4F5_FUSHE|nr:hypothetical protein FHETE_7691 [Fusarium heterosporum]